MNAAIRALACILLFLATVAFGAETKTITGKVTCSMCRGNHRFGKASDADCARACVKYGAKYILMSGDGSYIIEADPKQLDYYAEKTVTIRGEVDQGKIVKIEAISVAK